MSCYSSSIASVMYSLNLDILPNYYNSSKEVATTFDGPSIYFHVKALEWQKTDFLSDRHLEYIYATLVSWGMHRMGARGAKMPGFEEFKNSIVSYTPMLKSFKDLHIETITEEKLDTILPQVTDICFHIMASRGHKKIENQNQRSKLVSSSKVLAHILPNLICPIDRQYTLTFFRLKINNEQDEINAFQMVIKQMWKFYHGHAVINDMPLYHPFGESYPKIFDNLLIAYQKENKSNKTNYHDRN